MLPVIDHASAYPDMDGRRRVVLDMMDVGDEGDVTSFRARISISATKHLIAALKTALAILEETSEQTL